MNKTIVRIGILILVAIVAIIVVVIFVRSSSDELSESTAEIEQNSNQKPTQTSSQ